MNESQSISFEIQQTLPIKTWQQYPSNAFARQVLPEMLTDNGLQVVDIACSRNSRTPVNERTKAIYVFDTSFVVATIKRLFTRLQCDASQFMQLCSLACDYPITDDIPFLSDDSVAFAEFEQSQDDLSSAIALINALRDELATFRAMMPSPNEKGEYPVRYAKAVLLLEKLENIFKYECSNTCSIGIEPMTIDDVKTKLARL